MAENWVDRHLAGSRSYPIIVTLFFKILAKTLNLGQKSKFWLKVEILVKIETLVKNRNFSEKAKFLAKNPKQNRILSRLRFFILNSMPETHSKRTPIIIILHWIGCVVL